MENWPKFFKLIKYNELDSTNSEAKRLAFNDNLNKCIFSKTQTRGKGSRGRHWISGSKNLTASFLYYPKGNFINFLHRTFIVSLAVFDALKYTGVDNKDLILKWPNDVLLKNRKISGILLETVKDKNSSRLALIIGVGVNLNSYPPKIGLSNYSKIKPISLNTVIGKRTPSPEDMVTYIANSLLYWENTYIKEGFGNIKKFWLNFSYQIGKKLDFEFQGKVIEGSFSGISDDGSLRVLKDKKIVEINVGDVFFYN